MKVSCLGQIVGLNKGVLCLLGCSIYVYGWSDEGGEDGDGKEGNGKERSKIPGGWERVEIAWPLVCR